LRRKPGFTSGDAAIEAAWAELGKSVDRLILAHALRTAKRRQGSRRSCAASSPPGSGRRIARTRHCAGRRNSRGRGRRLAPGDAEPTGLLEWDGRWWTVQRAGETLRISELPW
jgi:hypothetical protein